MKLFRIETCVPLGLTSHGRCCGTGMITTKINGISPHSDASATYSNVDPITSFSFGHGGVLTLGPKKGPVTRMLFQEGGDALVMAGDFQAEFCHGVPARSTWKDLKSLPMFATMQEWEKVGLQQEIALHEGAEPEAKACPYELHGPLGTAHIGLDVRCGGRKVMGLNRFRLELSRRLQALWRLAKTL